jgi:hypothetical protein
MALRALDGDLKGGHDNWGKRKKAPENSGAFFLFRAGQ